MNTFYLRPVKTISSSDSSFISQIKFLHMQVLGQLDGEMDEPYKAKNIVQKLEVAFREVPNARVDAKFALRMTKASNNCINFHYDGPYASSTSQIPLNCPDDYKGGNLCFFVNGQISFVPRKPGSLVQHPPKVLHGVTRVTEGTRKSFFIIDAINTGGEGVVNLSSDVVISFLVSLLGKTNTSPSASGGKRKRGTPVQV